MSWARGKDPAGALGKEPAGYGIVACEPNARAAWIWDRWRECLRKHRPLCCRQYLAAAAPSRACARSARRD